MTKSTQRKFCFRLHSVSFSFSTNISKVIIWTHDPFPQSGSPIPTGENQQSSCCWQRRLHPGGLGRLPLKTGQSGRLRLLSKRAPKPPYHLYLLYTRSTLILRKSYVWEFLKIWNCRRLNFGQGWEWITVSKHLRKTTRTTTKQRDHSNQTRRKPKY